MIKVSNKNKFIIRILWRIYDRNFFQLEHKPLISLPKLSITGVWQVLNTPVRALIFRISKLTSDSIFHYLGQRIYQKTFLNWLGQYLFWVFFSKILHGGKMRDYPTELVSWSINLFVVNVFRVQHRHISSQCFFLYLSKLSENFWFKGV